MAPTISPNLWFDTQAAEAAEFYVEVFGGRVLSVTRYADAGPGPAGTVMTAEFEVAGQRFVALNGGRHVTFSEAVSFIVTCRDQDEVDRYWQRLTDGGEEGMCGWLRDRFGVSWQVVPEGLPELFADPDPDRVARAMQAMLTMRKLDLTALRAAADGTPDGRPPAV